VDKLNDLAEKHQFRREAKLPISSCLAFFWIGLNASAIEYDSTGAACIRTIAPLTEGSVDLPVHVRSPH
jgi:hypothetical protein